MLSLEEYISKRKDEDRLNEFEIESKMENMRICVNYVFEYFNQYLDISKMDEKTILNEERIEKYRKSLREYELEVQEWLVGMFNDYDKQVNRLVSNFLKKDDLFFIYSTDQEFRSVSYECYSQLIKKNPFLKNQTEMLFKFIKDHHRITSQIRAKFDNKYISEEVQEWIINTMDKHQVNLYSFACDYTSRFFNNEESWAVKHRIKSKDSWRKYEYDYKQKSDLFNINLLYRKVSNKPFLKGRKQLLEIVLMYCWLHEIEGDDEHYWQEYIGKTLG